MLEDGGYFDDGVFGYDFSEGYTSLESGAPKVRPYRESALKRWRRRRSELRRQRRMVREAAEEKRMDEILEKLHRDGKNALTDEEHRFLVRVSTRYRNRTKTHVIEPMAATAAPDSHDAISGRSRRRAMRSTGPPGARCRGRHAAHGAGARLGPGRSGLWNLTHPDDVALLHRADVAAGARAVVTNTFGANRSWLAKLGRPGSVEAINRGAVDLARQAALGRAFVLGGIGPTVAHEAGAAAHQAAVLAGCGVDAILLETFREQEIEAVLEEVVYAAKDGCRSS